MHKILFLISDLAYGGAAKQLVMLATALPRARFQTCVGVLGRAGALAPRLHAAGVEVVACDWKHCLDLAAWRRLRRLAGAFSPDVLHLWDVPALRWAALTRIGQGKQIVLRAAGLGERHSGRQGTCDRWLARSATCLVASGAAEAEQLKKRGLAPEHIVVIPPATTLPQVSGERPALTVPQGARLLACAGRLEPQRGFEEAIWALGMLKYLYADLHLLILGTGPHGDRLHQFAQDSEVADQVHFLGARADVADVLQACEIVWVPARGNRGTHLALEGMAAGKPVVAFRTSALAELVIDGATGYLVPPGDKLSMARQTRLLLEDADQRRRLGAAGRLRVEEQFSAATLVQRFTRLYSEGH